MVKLDLPLDLTVPPSQPQMSVAPFQAGHPLCCPVEGRGGNKSSPSNITENAATVKECGKNFGADSILSPEKASCSTDASGNNA